MPRRRRLATGSVALVLVALMSGCSGDASGSDDSDDAPSASNAGDSDESTPTCVGKDDGSIKIGLDMPVELPGGSTARLAVTDMAEDPPTVSFKLGQSTVIEQKHATDLAVGDEFGVARGVYVVSRICHDKAFLGEF